MTGSQGGGACGRAGEERARATTQALARDGREEQQGILPLPLLKRSPGGPSRPSHAQRHDAWLGAAPRSGLLLHVWGVVWKEVANPPIPLLSIEHGALITPACFCFGRCVQIRGTDADNLPFTRVAQRDIWVNQFPPNCSDPSLRFMVVGWTDDANGIGSQLHVMTVALSMAMKAKRVLLLADYTRAQHDGCKRKLSPFASSPLPVPGA